MSHLKLGKREWIYLKINAIEVNQWTILLQCGVYTQWDTTQPLKNEGNDVICDNISEPGEHDK